MGASNEERPDEGLIRMVLSGDDEAFAELVRRHKRMVFSIAGRYARNPPEIEDICQEIFLRAYRDLGGYRREAPFAHWLGRIAVRACYDALRKRRREEKDVSYESLPFPPASSGPEEDLSPVQAREILASAMARLAPDERLVVTMLELEERTVREISELTGWSEGNVKVRAHRARKALKRILEGDDEG